MIELIKRLINELLMSEEKREIVLKAAKKAFAEKGFAAVGIREIAREAGLNSATLYHYFENKEGIYAAVLEQTLDQVVAILSEVSQAEMEPEAQLRYAIDRYIDFIKENRDVLKILIHEYNLETEMVGRLSAKFYHKFFAIADEMLSAKKSPARVRQINPKHLLIAGIGLCTIYFVISPLFYQLEGKDQLAPEMLAEWKKSVSDLMLYWFTER